MTGGSLLVITGPPGAGKSTVAAIVANGWSSSVLVAGDRFFGFLAAGAIPPWHPESHGQNTIVTEAAGLATGRFADHYDTVFDGIVGPWFLPTFAGATGLAELSYAVILPSVETCQDRVATRVDHGFADLAATRAMHEQFATAEIDGRHLVSDDHGDAAEIARQIDAAHRSGRLRYVVSAGDQRSSLAP